MLCTAICAASAPKPVRIVAAYHDLENIRRYTPARYDIWHEIFIRRQGDGRAETCSIAPVEFRRYSAVILAGGYAKLRLEGDGISSNDTAQILQFMEDGGTLVITLPSYMRQFRTALGDLSARIKIIDHQLQRSFPAESPGHPLVDLGQGEEKKSGDGLDAILEEKDDEMGVLDEVGPTALDPMKTISSRFSVTKFEGAQSLAGESDYSCYLIVPVGKGKLILAPEEVLPDYSMAQVLDSTTIARDLKQAQLEKRQRLAGNLLRYLSPHPVGEVIKSAMQGAPPLVFWWREIPTITTEGPERMNPPYPLEGEALRELSMDVGRTEWERRLFFTTLNRPVARVSATVTDLEGSPGMLAVDQADVLALLRPTPEFSGPFVYLGKQEDLPPAGEPCVSIKRPASVLWCVRLHVQDAAPGEYSGAVVFNVDGEEFRLPLTVHVWPVRLDRRVVDHDVEYFFRSDYDYREPRMAGRLKDYDAALVDYREHWVNWVLAGSPGYSGMDGILREDGRRLADALVTDPERFRGADRPMLDLSHQDTLLNLFIERGMTVFRTYGVMGDLEKFREVAAHVYGKDDLTIDSPETAAMAEYWMREHARYLQEKGFPRIYTKIMDEWNETGLDAFLREARIAKAAGWRVIANPNQKAILDVPENRDRVWPLTDCWWYAYNAPFLATAHEMNTEGTLTGDEFWRTQTSSYWWNIAIRYGYQAGWEVAYVGFAGHHFHGWKRDPPGGVWLDTSRTPYAIFPSVGYELLGEGLEDGQYLSMAKEMVRGSTVGGGASIETQLQRITGPGEDSILGFHELGAVGETSLVGIGWQNRLRFEDFYRAKRELLALLVELQKDVPEPRIDLKWGDLYMIRAGKPTASITASKSSPYADVLNTVVRQKAHATLPTTAEADSPSFETGIRIVIGVRGDAWLDKLSSQYPRCGVTARYPHAGSYLIYLAPNGTLLMIIGGDAAGAELGVRNFTRFLEVRKAWEAD